MLKIYRRHLGETSTKPACRHEGDRNWRKCKCPVWVEGTTSTGYIRKSLKTANWENAEAMRIRLEVGVQEIAAGKSIAEAVASYLAEKTVENRADGTIRIAKRRLNEFADWCADEGYRTLPEVGIEALRQFRLTWKVAPNTAANKQGTLFAFFRFCLEADWITRNPAVKLSKIRLTRTPLDYYTPEEFEALMAAAIAMRTPKGPRMRAFLLLMRWTGLRISDVVGMARNRIDQNGNLLLFTLKTDTPVFAPLPPHVLQALKDMPSLPGSHPAYFFWTGAGKIETCANTWRRAFMTVVKAAGLEKRCHPHMFRDTFAVEALLAEVPIDQVSRMLGHASIKMTESHYMPFVRARQNQLSDSYRRMWPTQPAT